MTPDKLPATVVDAVRFLRNHIAADELSVIKNSMSNDLSQYHFTLGRWIRNNLGLWADNTALLADTGKQHPDDASMVIIEALWRDLQIDRYKETDR